VGTKLTCIYTAGPAMLQNSKVIGLFLMKSLAVVLLAVAATPLSAQTVRIVPVNIFDGGREVARGDWVFLYLRKPWKKFNPDQSIGLREFSFSQLASYRQSGGEFRLRAFDSSAGVISDEQKLYRC
jgi:hypothetical protein